MTDRARTVSVRLRARRRTRGVLLLGAALLVVVSAGGGTYAAFTATTDNTANTISSGTVAIQDDDSGGVLMSLSNAVPNDQATGCVKITYTGSLGSTIRLYGTVSGALAPYLTLTVTRGTQASPAFPACTGFSADATNYIGQGAGVVFRGALSTYPSTYAAGAVDPTAGTPETWTTSELRTYHFNVVLQNDAAAANKSASAGFTWEARGL